MRCAVILLGDGAADFPQLFHQVVAGVDAAGGVADEKLSGVGDGLLMGVKTHRRGVGIRVAGDHRDAESIAPALELLYGSGAIGGAAATSGQGDSASLRYSGGAALMAVLSE